MSSDRDLTQEVDAFLARAKSLFPKLQARRASLVAELASVEAALSRLAKLAGTPLAKSAAMSSPRPRSVSPPKRARKRRARTRGGRTLSAVVIETLTDKGVLGLSELSRAIAAQHGAKLSGLPRLLWVMKNRGLIHVEGTAGSFRYSAVRAE